MSKLLAAAFLWGALTAAAPPPTVVLLPAHDLSGGRAPLDDVDRLVFALLAYEPVALVPRESVAAFLDARRIRHTGGLGPQDMAALRDELHAEVVIVVGAEVYVAEEPPRAGLSAMAFSTADGAPLGTAEAVLSGEEHPGLLGMGEVFDPEVLLERAARAVVDELSASAFRDRRKREFRRPRGALRPSITSRAPDVQLPERRPLRVAVLPFENRSEAGAAGEVLAGQVLRALVGRGEVQPLDPGTVRANLLEYRVVQDWGVSLAQTDALRVGLDTDLVVTGRVVQFSDGGAGSTPQVAFSLRVLDVRGRRAIWSCYGANRGDDGVIVFDAGRYRSAHALSRDMAEAAVGSFLRELERNFR